VRACRGAPRARAGEQVALEQLEAEPDAALELLLPLDLLGEQAAAVPGQPVDEGGQRVRRRRRDVDLHVVGEGEQRVDVPVGGDVVQRDGVAALAQPVEPGHDRGVRLHVLEHLEHHLLGGEGHGPGPDEERPREVDERQPVPDELPQAEVEERGHEDLGRGGVGVVDVGRRGRRRPAEEQLVARDAPRGVDDGVLSDVHSGVLSQGQDELG
jgi:hypothetical protein